MRHFFIFLFVITFLQTNAKIRLPALVGDGMVLQRNTVLNIWGWANKNEKVTIRFLDQKQTTRADKDGKWAINLKPVSEGGPHILTVEGENTITLKDILVGDIWICGGQSNMGWKLSWGVEGKDEAIATADFPMIRLFTVKESISFKVKDDVVSERGWEHCSATNVGDFSAVAFFFGRELYKKYKIPVGLISSNRGGSPAEAWLSATALKTLPDYSNQMYELEKLSSAVLQSRFETRLQEWALKTVNNDKGYEQKWYNLQLDTKNWKSMKLPSSWENTPLPDYDGIVWFRKEIEVAPFDAGKELTLFLARPDDLDSTWFNGKKIGGLEGEKVREYKVPGSLVKAGKNIISMRVLDFGGGGGINGKPEEMRAQIGAKTIDLAGDWKYMPGNKSEYTSGWPPRSPEVNASELAVLYNGMITPLTPFKIKGVIFYQGEGNVKSVEKYYPLFTALIKDWRSAWNDNIPFIFTQLSTSNNPDSIPQESKLAQLRETQLHALVLPNTAMAVTVDIGSKDVHPLNKLDVGKRLALAAEKVAYKKDVVHSGPIYQTMQISGDKILLKFTEIGSGLQAKDKYGYLRGFAIAGDDNKFVWANAVIEANTVIVYSNSVKNPTAVRYAWSDNPADANLYNKEGLPASPFRTDK
ncbi:MAG TPA: sialate O-acetylesterase [Pedobacter sp.]|jgi:sialate O-acetylesterase